jgi:predicted transcriptional regulator of viral defense system
MAKILNWINVQKRLREKGLLLFTPWELRQLFRVSKTAANFFVYRWAKKGPLIRVKKSRKGSLYAIADNFPNQYLIANRIYLPSYISFDAALSFHGVIPETIYTITSATTKATRKFQVAGINYEYFRVKISVYTGYKPVKYMDTIVLMAEPEKALADYLYFVDLKKRGLHYERINLKKIKKYRLIQYIKLFARPRILKLMERIYADARKPSRIY